MLFLNYLDHQGLKPPLGKCVIIPSSKEEGARITTELRSRGIEFPVPTWTRDVGLDASSGRRRRTPVTMSRETKGARPA